MLIVLINLPSPALGEPWSNFPLGIGYLGGFLQARGYQVKIEDWCDVDPERLEIIAATIPRADVYGLSATTPQIGYLRRAARIIHRSYPDALIVAGGPHFHPLAGHQTDSLQDVDVIIGGEGEEALHDLVTRYRLSNRLWPPRGRTTIINRTEIERDLDRLPFPSRDLLPLFKAKSMWSRQLLKGSYCEGGQTTIIASRGCPYSCAFCAPHDRHVRFRSPENVAAEIRYIADMWGIYQLKWQDDTLTTNKRWVLRMCDQIIHRCPPVYMRGHTRVNVFDEEMADRMARAGFKVLCFGIESFDQRLLDLNAKQITVAQIERSLRIARDYGFKTVGFLIFGMPGEDAASVEATKAGIIRNKPYLDYLNLATMVPLPGTPVYQHPDRFGVEIIEPDPERAWIVDHETSNEVLVRSKHVPLAEMRALKKSMYDFMRAQGYSRAEWKKGE